MKGLPRSMARGAAVRQEIVKLRIPVNKSFAVADGAPGYGTVVLSALPQGNLLYLGLVSYLKFTKTDADITATFDGDYSIGSAPDANGTLAGAEVDLLASTPFAAAAVGSTTAVMRAASAVGLCGVILDNTDGSLEMNLNLILDDGSISGAGTMDVDGLVEACFIILGDD